MQRSTRVPVTASAAAFATRMLRRRTFDRARIPLQRDMCFISIEGSENALMEGQGTANVRQRCRIPQHHRR